MRICLLTALLVACGDSPVQQDMAVQNDLSEYFEPGCEQVKSCFALPAHTTFASCAMPFPPGTNASIAQPYYDCVVGALGGACKTMCQYTDGGVVPLDCTTCINGDCGKGTCTGGACSTQAAACSFGGQ
jgi:hypothetical protein